ncbi:MAG TPA: YihA family ribosome biogenesis GTP-binding protein [Candidatus Cryptobacteroides merdipullorum]|uniref:Probable GTP-binding protein EngB n=1 Tax=Candidatus Cryptobacteroides merdipullorum TaxID=2840771 RepID=A0A9D1GNC7_9BACT|nr:YihA family ribosome biogenesis GTP-binding protein [Candidatus Cryptobacteroides merdipullorum]
MRISEAKFAGSSTRVCQKPRRKLPEFAFIGRSNVGKSSLINALCGNGRLAMTSATPGKTKLVNHFLINDSWYLVDLPGYGYAKAGRKGREEIAAVINDYILNSGELVLLFVLIDSRHDIGTLDKDFIARLGEEGIPFALVMTKCDKQGPNVLAAQIERDMEILREHWEELPPVFTTSSLTGRGREEILDYIDNILKSI